MIHQTKKKKKRGNCKNRELTVLRENIVQQISTNRRPYETNNRERNSLVMFRHMKTITNGATLIKKRTVELHVLLPRCKEHPELVDDDEDAAEAEAEAAAEALLLLPAGLIESVVVVSARDGAVVGSAAIEAPPIEAGRVRELTETNVAGPTDESVIEPEGDDDELPVAAEDIRVMAKAGLVSPESPNTRIQVSFFFRA